MKRIVPWALVVMFASGIAAISTSWSNPLDVAVRPLPPIPPPTTFGYRIPAGDYCGATSCASVSCHGGQTPGKPGSEYTTWTARDPHSRAHQVLFNDVSEVIARNMVRVRDGYHKGEYIPPYRDALCLKCHALNLEKPERVPVLAPDAAGGKREPATVAAREVFPNLGVSCESCHGPAGSWLTTHYQPEFKKLSAREKAERFAFYPTRDLAFRASLCASCHVGTENQEVNHDLIAAGHPRLNFEFASYHRNPKYQKHWSEKDYGNDFEVRAFAIGQVATARAAVDLLRSHAARDANPHVPWPEFTDFSCYACHKDLDKTISDWKKATRSDRRPGSLPWGTWTTPLLAALAEQTGLTEDGAVPKFDRAAALLKKMKGPLPDRKELVGDCESALKELDAWLLSMQAAAVRDSRPKPLPESVVSQLRQQLFRHALTGDASFRDIEWDGVQQHYLALVTLETARSQLTGTPGNPETLKKLDALKQALAFPPGYNSPRGVNPAQVLRLFQELHEPTRKREPSP